MNAEETLLELRAYVIATREIRGEAYSLLVDKIAKMRDDICEKSTSELRDKVAHIIEWGGNNLDENNITNNLNDADEIIQLVKDACKEAVTSCDYEVIGSGHVIYVELDEALQAIDVEV